MGSPYLNRIPSWLFGVLYLLLIPAFAMIYMTFSGEFYHATVQHERYMKSDEQQILAALRDSMISTFVETYGSRAVPDSPLLDWDYIYLYDLQYANGWYSFALLADAGGRVERLPPTTLRIRFALSWPRVRPGDSSAKMYGLSTEREMPGFDLLRTLFPINRRFSDEVQPETLGFVVLPELLERQLVAWSEARRGFPAASQTSWPTFWRLLYLSAITITTVGYGDILPVTTRARLWVAFEAVLGVVMIGLFLNSLAIKAQGRRNAASGGAA